MYNLKMVHLFDCETYLSKPSKHIVIGKEDAFVSSLVIDVFPSLDLLVEVSLLAIIHNYAELASFCLEYIAVTNYEIMLENFKDFSFS